LTRTLKQGTLTQLRSDGRFGIRNPLMVFQAAGSLLMLVTIGYILVGFNHTYRVDADFDTENLYLFALDPARDGYSTEQSARLLDRLPEQLQQRPEIRTVALSLDVPFPQVIVMPNTSISVADDSGENVIHRVVRHRIGASYFSALGVPLIRGREFIRRDQNVDDDQENPIILNRAAAELFVCGQRSFRPGCA
jgi:hypothetical protein